MKDTMAQQTSVSIENLQATLKNFLEITHSKSNTNNIEQLQHLYKAFITEEYNELLCENSNTPNDFKELCDLMWVCIQYANTCGYDIAKGMNELIKEYKSKLYDDAGNFCATFREDGKLLKGEYFKRANFKQLVG